jgi:arylsulfatase
MFKHWCHEGGIATPLIARWPTRMRDKGVLTHQVAHITDILPTCLDLAGVTYPESFEGRAITPTVGKSLTPIFDGKTRKPHERLYWEHEGNRAVREDRWKLVAAKGGKWELYDLEADRTELHNLAKTNPDKAAELNTAWEQWAKQCGVSVANIFGKE